MKKIGIIGTGMIAEMHISAFQKYGEVAITWIAEIRKELLEKVQAKYHIPHGTTDYFDILKASEVDAVLICTPPKFHKKMCLDALEAGKHVLLEKPVAIDLGELQEILEAKKARPELIVSGCSARHARLQPKFKLVKKMIDSGKLGDIYYIHHASVARQSRGGIEYHPTAKWFLNKEIAGGGPMLDWGVYDLSFHLGILSDKPELISVKAATMKQGLDAKDPGTAIFDVEEHGFALMEFTNGLTYYWERASHANMDVPNETRIYGTKGGLKFGFCSWDPPTVEFFYVEDEGKGEAKSEILEVDMGTHDGDEEALAKHFARVLEGTETPQMPFELSKKHLEIIHAVYGKVK